VLDAQVPSRAGTSRFSVGWSAVLCPNSLSTFSHFHHPLSKLGMHGSGVIYNVLITPQCILLSAPTSQISSADGQGATVPHAEAQRKILPLIEMTPFFVTGTSFTGRNKSPRLGLRKYSIPSYLPVPFVWNEEGDRSHELLGTLHRL
jgi:hypothetical protein